jgi:predicted heme/steroid binding protein
MTWTTTLSAACLALCLTACNSPEPLTQQEKQTVTELTANLSPRCVGRYLIDMPNDALTFGDTKVQGVRLEAQAMSQQDYQNEVDARGTELKAIKHVKGYPFLLADGPAWEQGTRYFVHLENAYEGNISRVIEAYKWSNGFRIKLQTMGNDVTTSFQKDNPAAQSIGNDVPEKTRLVFGLLEKVRGRPEDDIPTEPGICFRGGFLPGKATDQENISTQFMLHDKLDVSFGLDTDSNIRESTTLLQRGGNINNVLKNTEGGRTIRNGSVPLPGMPAEEWLMAGRTPLGVQGHFLTLEANSKIGSAQTPLVSLDMHNGWPNRVLDVARIENASLSEGEVVALWDAVSRTLRPRPNGF